MFERFVLGRRVAQVVEGMARHFAQENGLQHLGQNDLFETFAAYCIVKRYHQDFEPDELRAGGHSDLGIDAYAVIIDGEVFTDPAEVMDYVADRRQIQVRFVIVQAKRQHAFDGLTFVKLANGIALLFGHEDMNVKAGKGARRLRECVRAIYQDIRKFEQSGMPRLDVWYASLGRYRPAFHRARREAAYRQLDDTKLFRLVEVAGAGAVELRNAYRDTAPGVVATLALPAARRVELPYIPGVKRAFLGVLRARDLVDGVLLDEHKDRRLHLYDENLRDFLGTVRNPVNSEIEATLANNVRRSQFAVLNNGVTIVARSLVASPTDILLRGPRVVNGCQTCNVLALSRDKLADDVMVNVRVIESSDGEVVSAIVRATNRQTAISQDVLTARDDFQREVEDFCASRPDGREVYFERRLQQYGTKPRSRVINRRHLVQSYATMWMDSPENVARYHTLSTGKSGPIFASGHDPLFYYLAAAAYLNVGRLIGHGIPPQYRPARFHLLYGLKLLAFGAGPVQLVGDHLDAASNRMLDVLWDQDHLRSVVAWLLPALDRSLAAEASLSELSVVVRTELFTARFQRAVLELPPLKRPLATAA
jgi:hypothetical protein